MRLALFVLLMFLVSCGSDGGSQDHPVVNSEPIYLGGYVGYHPETIIVSGIKYDLYCLYTTRYDNLVYLYSPPKDYKLATSVYLNGNTVTILQDKYPAYVKGE